MASVDTLVIGRKPFETVLDFPVWPHGDKHVVVRQPSASHRGGRPGRHPEAARSSHSRTKRCGPDADELRNRPALVSYALRVAFADCLHEYRHLAAGAWFGQPFADARPVGPRRATNPERVPLEKLLLFALGFRRDGGWFGELKRQPCPG